MHVCIILRLFEKQIDGEMVAHDRNTQNNMFETIYETLLEVMVIKVYNILHVDPVCNTCHYY